MASWTSFLVGVVRSLVKHVTRCLHSVIVCALESLQDEDDWPLVPSRHMSGFAYTSPTNCWPNHQHPISSGPTSWPANCHPQSYMYPHGSLGPYGSPWDFQDDTLVTFNLHLITSQSPSSLEPLYFTLFPNGVYVAAGAVRLLRLISEDYHCSRCVSLLLHVMYTL